MDDATTRDLIERMERLEAKVDKVIAFTGALQGLLNAWMSGGKGKALATLMRLRGGGDT